MRSGLPVTVKGVSKRRFVSAECVATVEPETSSSAPAAQQQARANAQQQQQQAQQNGAGDGGFVSKRSVRLQRSFPLTAVVCLDVIKQALLLGACDTGLLTWWPAACM